MRILGLDIGTTSIGFALIDLDKDRESGSIVRLGVRIFPEARDPDGTPLNQAAPRQAHDAAAIAAAARAAALAQ